MLEAAPNTPSQRMSGWTRTKKELAEAEGALASAKGAVENARRTTYERIRELHTVHKRLLRMIVLHMWVMMRNTFKGMIFYMPHAFRCDSLATSIIDQCQVAPEYNASDGTVSIMVSGDPSGEDTSDMASMGNAWFAWIQSNTTPW
jgi:hypothetical protein